MGQLWSTPNKGGFMFAPNLSKVLRREVAKECRFRQFTDCRESDVKKKGQQFQWNVFNDLTPDVNPTSLNRELTEGVAMPSGSFTIVQESLTLKEHGIQVPFTSFLDLMSEQSVTEVVTTVLKNDARKSLDAAAYAQFNLTKLRAAPTGGNSTTAVSFSDTGSTAIVNNQALTKAHVARIADYMEGRNIPAFDNDTYMAVSRVEAIATFRDELEAISHYVDEGYRMIYRGEKGRYRGVRFVVQTNIANQAWANAKSDPVFFFGDDTVVEGVAMAEEVRGKIGADYGRDLGVAWMYVGGFGIAHTDALNSRIVKWDTAPPP